MLVLYTLDSSSLHFIDMIVSFTKESYMVCNTLNVVMITSFHGTHLDQKLVLGVQTCDYISLHSIPYSMLKQKTITT